MRKSGSGNITAEGYKVFGHRLNGRKILLLEHVVVAERAIGKPLPKNAVVHHINGDRLDNRPENLVVCPNSAYHTLIHRRQRALDQCGSAGYRKCPFCKIYDDPASMYTPPRGSPYHKQCYSKYRYALRHRRKGDC